MVRIPSNGANLNDLEPTDRYENLKAAAYKTVDMFAGICQRKLWMRHVRNATPSTDGTVIVIDLDDECMYQEMEHELAHILFQSDSLAKAKFVESYSNIIRKFAAKHGVSVDQAVLENMLHHIVGTLEDQRVNSLWSELYPGSTEILLEHLREKLSDKRELAMTSFLALLHFVSLGIDTPPGPYDDYKPIFAEALAQVERRGFLSTLVTAKWLVTAMVDRLIEGAVAPPPPPMEAEGEEGEGESGGEQPALDSGLSSEGQNEDASDLTVLLDAARGIAPEKQNASNEGVPSPAGQLEGGGSGPSQRAEAMGQLMEQLGDGDVDKEMSAIANDVTEGDPKYRRYSAERRAEQLAQQAMNANVKDEDKLQEVLAASAAEMDELVKQTKQAIRHALDYDTWLLKDSLAKVVITDVEESKDASALLLNQEDQDTVRRLRGLFFKVLGRLRTRLEPDGTEVDVQAYIEQRISKTMVPCFRQSERGRGFKALVLLDRSGSMNGEKTLKAERACRIIQKALNFPFVEFDVWGFNSLENGQVNIARFDPECSSFSGKASKIAGLTPLHTAVRVGLRHLEAGQETKQLVIITDGQPMYCRKDGKHFSGGTLMLWTRDSIRTGRRHGVNVTSLVIDSFTEDKWLQLMFGSPRYWKKISTAKMGNDIVKLICGSFVNYLQNR